MEHPLVGKIFRFLIGGGVVWSGRAGLTAALHHFLAVDAVIAYRFGLGVSFVIYFFLNAHFIFRVRDRLVWRLVKYTLTSLSFLSVDGLLMGFLYQKWGWHYMLALSCSTLSLMIVKFCVMNFFVFQPTKLSTSMNSPDL
ncbi:MAG: GtrA family protein [SAR324 cluster bacterium]|nr:GtrA family protein [SAR324 cluster bacterium]